MDDFHLVLSWGLLEELSYLLQIGGNTKLLHGLHLVRVWMDASRRHHMAKVEDFGLGETTFLQVQPQPNLIESIGRSLDSAGFERLPSCVK